MSGRVTQLKAPSKALGTRFRNRVARLFEKALP
jgi:hypothetical protein